MMTGKRFRDSRTIQRTTAFLLALLMVGSTVASTLVAADTKTKAAKGLTEEQKILHLLNRTGFGARPGDVERVKRLGIDKYLDLQLHPERIDDAALAARLQQFESLDLSLAEINEKYPAPQVIARELGLLKAKKQQPDADKTAPDGQPDKADEEKDKREYRQALMEYYRTHDAKPVNLLLQELQGQKIIRAIYSERQLQEVMSDFWFNHFNVFWAKNGVRSTATDYEMNVIRPHTMGKFKDMLLATAKSSAMMQYLDNFQSSSPDMQLPGRRGNLNPLAGNGGQKRGRFGAFGGNPNRQLQGDDQMNDEMMKRRQQAAQQFAKRKPGINENYARELMELHTLGVDGGYSQKDVQEVARCFTGWSINFPAGGKKAAGEFAYKPFMHDNGEKTILGQKIPAGGGMKDGEMVIDILAHSPITAKFISTKLVRRFVSDNPPQALIDRVAGVYMKSDGDIREMLKTIFTAPEFYAPESYRAKIKTPFELAVSAVRAMGGETVNARQMAQFIAKMGQPLYLYQPPTGYPDRAEQWVNTGVLLERLNFGLALSSNRVAGTNVDVNRLAGKADMVNDKQAMDKAIAVLLNNEVSPQTRSVLEKQLREGIAVKGELGDVSKIPTVAGAAMPGEEMMADDSAPARKAKGGDALTKADRKAENAYRRFGGGPTIAQAKVDPELAKVFGLVLGSPEFQRR